jgi:hypothetical protein
MMPLAIHFQFRFKIKLATFKASSRSELEDLNFEVSEI